MAGSERGVAIVEATEGREMAPRPGNARSEQIRGGSGLFVLNAGGSKNSVYSVNNFLEFMKNNIVYNNIISVCRSNNN